MSKVIKKTNTKIVNEKYCRDCGAAINAKAEICPKCGVRQIEVNSNVGCVSGNKDRLTAGLLAIFFGGWGLHKFYLGYTTSGLIYLLTNTVGFFITWIMLGIPNWILYTIAFVEGIIYLTKSNEEFQIIYVKNKKEWF